MNWSQYKRKGLTEARPYAPGEDTNGISIAEVDRKAGSPREGDMIARNPDNHADQWLIAKSYFEKNLEPADAPTTCLPFGVALEALKSGRKVARDGWNGRGMYLWLLPAQIVPIEWTREPHLREICEAEGGSVECLGSIRMFTVNASGRRAVLTGWLASQTDMLSNDWRIVG